MNQNHLDYFIAISEAGSFTEAARRLFVSRQALSRSINALESELGVTLFARGKTAFA